MIMQPFPIRQSSTLPYGPTYAGGLVEAFERMGKSDVKISIAGSGPNKYMVVS